MKKDYRLLDFHGPVQGKGVRIAFPESTEPRTLRAVRFLSDNTICVPVLIGDRSEIRSAADAVRVFVDDIEVIPHDPDRFSQELADLRKEKGLTREQARELLKDCMYFATMLLHNDIVAGVVSGAVHPTAHTMRPALQIIKCRPGVKLASSFFIMETDKGLWFFADCAINIEPTAEELADIGLATAQTALRFGVQPKVAFLSYSTKGSGNGHHDRAEHVAKAVRLAQAALPNVAIDGEMQVDAAMDEETGRLKAPGSPVAGHANVFIFPNIDAGNIGYKLVERFADAEAIGPIVQGLNKPVNDLSRGCTAEDIVEVAAITAMQALHW